MARIKRDCPWCGKDVGWAEQDTYSLTEQVTTPDAEPVTSTMCLDCKRAEYKRLGVPLREERIQDETL